MVTHSRHSADTTPPSEAITKPSPREDAGYFTQEVEYTRQAINDMRIEMNNNAAESKAEITKAVDTFIKNTIEVNGKAATLSAEVKGQYVALDVSIKHLTKSIDEMKPKIDTLNNWRFLLIGGGTVIGALLGVVITLLIKSGMQIT